MKQSDHVVINYLLYIVTDYSWLDIIGAIIELVPSNRIFTAT